MSEQIKTANLECIKNCKEALKYIEKQQNKSELSDDQHCDSKIVNQKAFKDLVQLDQLQDHDYSTLTKSMHILTKSFTNHINEKDKVNKNLIREI